MRHLILFLALALLAPALAPAANFAISPAFKLYTETTGQPLNNGYVYFGVAGQNAETNPTTVFWDVAGTIPAAQPIRTVNGYPARNGTPTLVYASGDHSVTVRNARGALVYSSPNSTDFQLAGAILSSAGGAAFISITDAGGFYAGTSVEAALQEAAQAATIRIADAGNLFAATNVEAALQEAIISARLATAVQQALVPTGTVLDYAGRTDQPAPSGWVYSTGTIGNALSGATRANADTQALFILWWEATTNTEVQIQDQSGTPLGARGSSGLADFNANRRLPLPDCRGRVVATKDDLGGTSANRLTSGGGGVNAIKMGAVGGAETHTLAATQMPVHNHSVTDPGHAHGYSELLNGGTGHTHATVLDGTLSFAPSGAGTGVRNVLSNGGNGSTLAAQIGIQINSTTTGISIQNTGGFSGVTQAHNNTQPTIVLSKIIKLAVPLDFTGAN